MHKPMLAVTGALMMGFLSASVQAAPPEKPTSELAQQCIDQAMAKEPKLQDLPYGSDNMDSYEKGEEFDLEVTLYGKGNAMMNLDCKIDRDGSLSYQGYERSGRWAG